MTLTAQEAAGSVVVAETAAAPEKTDTKAVDKEENRAYIDVQEILPQVSPDEAAVLRLLEDGKQPVDRLIDETQLPAGRILSALTLLEVKGYVKRLPARYYELAKKNNMEASMPNAKQNLVIVESPSKAKTIGKYLGPDYQVKASMGHLRDLAKSTLSVDIEHDFEPEYYPLKGKEEIISELQKAAKHADRVYLATDPDREGEAISWHLKYLLSIPDDATYRVTFNEITRGVVQESIQHPRPIDQNLVDAQQAAACSTGSSAISSARCCGGRSARVCLPAACSRSPRVWSSTGKTRSAPSSRRNTGRWM